MTDIPVRWKMEAHGAEAVKTAFAEINQQLERGEISQAEYEHRLRTVGLEAGKVVRTQNSLKNVYLATHPTLNNLTRAMSVFGSVNRAVMNSLNTINLAMIAFNTNSASLAQATADVDQAQRELSDTIAKFGPDSKQAIEAADNLRVAQAKLAEETQQKKDQILNTWVAIGSGIANVATGVILSWSKVAPSIDKLFKNFKFPSFGASAGAGAGAGGGIGAVFFPDIDKWIRSWSEGYDKWATWREKISEENYKFFTETLPKGIIDAGPIISEFFIKTLPDIISEGSKLFIQGGINMFNGFIELVNLFGKGVIDGINSMVIAIINFVNAIIDAINSKASWTGISIPKIPTPELLKYNGIGKIQGSAQTTNKSESSNIPPINIPSTAGSIQYVLTQNVNGSIVSENEIKKLWDRWLKEQLLSTGFR